MPPKNFRASKIAKYPGAKPNKSILSFFQKTEPAESELFVPERQNSSVKRRKVEDTRDPLTHEAASPAEACTPPPSVQDQQLAALDKGPTNVSASDVKDAPPTARKVKGPFTEDSESEDEDAPSKDARKTATSLIGGYDPMPSLPVAQRDETDGGNLPVATQVEGVNGRSGSSSALEDAEGDFEGFEDQEDFEGNELEGEEFQERRWVEELEHREAANDECEVNPEELDSQFPPDPDIFSLSKSPISDCPICGLQFINFSEEQVSIHVNKCLDGKITTTISKTSASATVGQLGCDAERLPPGHTPPKPAQPSPFPLNSVHAGQPSAFSKLMASNAEDAAWANAAASEEASRGKRSFERTCPFYKILPGFAICVDAFRYGAVEGCQAYFLSHFHSDHYIGLSGKWCHGPIYCSRATGNLVRQQLRVDPKWVVDLDFEQETEVPGTGGVTVIMIPANHCPGSSLFLFQKALGKGPNPKKRRVLHCGDFRACRSHVEHPHLCPSIPCPTSGKTKLQKIDVCYLDTTYLNPKYAFPPQEDVVQACVDMSVSLNNSTSNLLKGTKQEGGLAQFVKNGDTAAPLAGGKSDIKRNQGRLLIVVGTYSIGKEKICIAIAKALKSKIFASTPKRRICACLEDPELDELLTSNPREAQVHMAPLSELQPQTLDAYLQDFQDCFQSIVGFRPSGWNYRPPTGRSMTNLTVKTVLFGQNWKSRYAVNNMGPQRGSTKRAACFGVPYSEHSSFRELTMFCCALHIDRIIPTVNTGSAKSRQMMRYWADQWGAERRKNGLFSSEHF